MPNKLETSGRLITPPSIPDGIPNHVRVQLEIALGEYGTREDKGRPNRGPRVDEYVRGVNGRFGYLLGSSWCGMFARWCVDAAAERLKIPSPLPTRRDLASGLKWIEWAEETGRIVPGPEPGAVAILRTLGTSQSHIYTVVDSFLDDDFSIEGNSAQMVCCRARSSFLVTAYVRVW